MAFNHAQKIGAAAIIMALSVLLSRFMGLLRDKIISWQFGAAGESDIYFAAFVVPDFLNYLLAGGYVSITLIPLLAERFENDEHDAWKFFGAVFCWATLAIGLLTAFCWIIAPQLAPMAAPGFDMRQCARLSTFLRIVLPAQVFFLPGACLSAILYIRHQFFVPALIPIVYNGCILLFGVGLPKLGIAAGMEGFCWGVLIGALTGAFALPLLAVRSGGLKCIPTLRHKLLKRFFLLALPLMIGQSVVVLDEQFVRIFGSMGGEGAVSLLNYARRIMLVPVGVVAQAAGVASFPFLASLAAKNDLSAFRSTLNITLKNSMIIAVPVTAWMISMSGPVLGFIFEGGSFSISHTAQAAPLLQLMLLAVPFWLLQQVTGRAFYATQDTITPALIGTAATFVAVPCFFVAAPRLGALGVALVTSLSVAIYAALLLAVASRRWGKGAFAGVGIAALRSLALSIPGCAAVWGVLRINALIEVQTSMLLRQFAVLAIGGSAFAVLWLLCARLFCPSYFALIARPLLGRLTRHAGKRRDP